MPQFGEGSELPPIRPLLCFSCLFCPWLHVSWAKPTVEAPKIGQTKLSPAETSWSVSLTEDLSSEVKLQMVSNGTFPLSCARGQQVRRRSVWAGRAALSLREEQLGLRAVLELLLFLLPCLISHPKVFGDQNQPLLHLLYG